jgi:hypothetical protein
MDAAEAIEALGVSETVFTADLEEYLVKMDGRKYSGMSDQALHQFIARFIGQAQNIRGTTADGRTGRGKGRYTAPILEKAVMLNEKFNPEPEEIEEEEDELEFIPDEGPVNEIAA